MTPPLTLPIPAAELAAHVARLWPLAARECGVDPAHYGCAVDNFGEIYPPAPTPRAAWLRALSQLADALESDPLYLAVSRESDSVRVLGWAATPAYPAGPRLRVASLDATDRRRQAHDAAVLAGRQARMAAAAAPPGAPGTMSRGQMAASR